MEGEGERGNPDWFLLGQCLMNRATCTLAQGKAEGGSLWDALYKTDALDDSSTEVDCLAGYHVVL